MNNNSFKTKLQLAAELGISARTLHRWIKAAGYKTSGKLLSPKEQHEISLLIEKKLSDDIKGNKNK